MLESLAAARDTWYDKIYTKAIGLAVYPIILALFNLIRLAITFWKQTHSVYNLANRTNINLDFRRANVSWFISVSMSL